MILVNLGQMFYHKGHEEGTELHKEKEALNTTFIKQNTSVVFVRTSVASVVNSISI